MPLPPNNSRRPCDGLAGFGGAECLRKCRVMIRQLAFVFHLRQPNHKALAGRDIGEHLGKEILHHLERGDGFSELLAFLGSI